MSDQSSRQSAQDSADSFKKVIRDTFQKLLSSVESPLRDPEQIMTISGKNLSQTSTLVMDSADQSLLAVDAPARTQTKAYQEALRLLGAAGNLGPFIGMIHRDDNKCSLCDPTINPDHFDVISDVNTCDCPYCQTARAMLRDIYGSDPVEPAQILFLSHALRDRILSTAKIDSYVARVLATIDSQHPDYYEHDDRGKKLGRNLIFAWTSEIYESFRTGFIRLMLLEALLHASRKGKKFDGFSDDAENILDDIKLLQHNFTDRIIDSLAAQGMKLQEFVNKMRISDDVD